MRKVIYAMSVSLDGFIEATDGDLRWSYPDEELHRHFNEQEKRIDTHLYGRGLYENMASYWPTAGQNPSAPAVEIEYARIWKEMQKIVFSRTLKQVGWNSRLVSGDIVGEVERLKAQPGRDISVGGAGLANSFMQLGLIDEYRLYLHPLALGAGKPMFGPLQKSISLQLLESHTFGSGVVLLRYLRADR
jgi:dihydrofolate reductase